MNGRLGYRAVALTVMAGLFHPIVLWAGMENCRFALHRKANTTKLNTLCTTYSPNATSTPCWSYVTTGPIVAASHVYMVVAHGGSEGIAAASFGIDYHGGSNSPGGTGIDPAFVKVTWCADGLAFPNDGGNGEFPRPKGGVRVTWNLPGSCQLQVNGIEGVHAVIGALYCYAYSSDQLQMTPNNNLDSGVPELAVADCIGNDTDLVQRWGLSIASQYCCSRVDFGGGLGMNACDTFIMPSLPNTWGKMKSMYPRATTPASENK